MRQKFVLYAVLLCLLDIVTPTVLPKLVDSLTEKDLIETTTTITTFETSTDDNIQENVGVAPQGGNWFNSLFGQNGNGPSLVVEVNDATNDASLKIINLPLVRYTKNGTVLETNVPSTLSSTTTTSPSHTPKSRRKRDIDFQIHDKGVIKALIDALKGINWQRANFMQDNIDRLNVNVEIDDNDRTDGRQFRSIQKQSEVDFGQWKKSSNCSSMPRNMRRSRAVKFEIYDVSVIKAVIDALLRVDRQRAILLQNNIERVEISVEVEDYDVSRDDRWHRNTPEQSKLDLEPRTARPDKTNVPHYYRAHDVEFKIHDVNVIRELIYALKKVDPQRANFMQENINRVEIQVEVDDDDNWEDDLWRRSISRQSKWNSRERKQRNNPNDRRKRDVDFKIYDRNVIKALIDALQKIDPQRANFMLNNIDRVEVEVEVEDYDVRTDDYRLHSNPENTQIGIKKQRENTYNNNLPQYRRRHEIDFKIYDRNVIKALIDALQKVDPQRANFMMNNIDGVEVNIEVEYYDNRTN